MADRYTKVTNYAPHIFERIQSGTRRSKAERLENPGAPTYYDNLTGVLLKPRFVGDCALNTNPAAGAVDPVNSRDVSDPCYNRAYDKFKGQVYEQAQVLASLGEGKSTLSMMTKRATQLLELAKAVKNFDLKSIESFVRRSAAKRILERASRGGRLVRSQRSSRNAVQRAGEILGNASRRDQRQRPVSVEEFMVRTRNYRRSGKASDLWLELHFGWVPLLDEIGTLLSMHTSHAFVRNKVQASASTQVAWSESGGNVVKGPIRKGSMTIRHRIGAKIEVRNQDLFNAEQAGLLNPLAVAWELVPFSFVVDWFTSLGSVIASLSDFSGLRLYDVYHTQHRVCEASERFPVPDPPFFTEWGDFLAVRTVRVLTVPGPQLVVKSPLEVFKSLTRAATAVSLLVQQLNQLDNWTHYKWQKR